MGRLDMVNVELACQNLILLTMCLKKQPQEVLGPLSSFLRAFHVDAEQHDLSIMALINISESLCWELMPVQGTEHWRSYIKTACDISLPVMLFVQVVHKAGSSSQVPVSDAHQGEAEVQAGDGPATEPQEEGEGHDEEEEGHGHTHFEVAIDEGEVNEELLRWFEMEANGDERGSEEESSDDEDDPLVPRIATVKISHSYLSMLVRMWPGSIDKMQFLLAPCLRVQ
jgi:hypothetical protein